MSTKYYIRTFISDFHAVHSEGFTELISYPPRHEKNVGVDPTAITIKGGTPGSLFSKDDQEIYHFGNPASAINISGFDWYTYPLTYTVNVSPTKLFMFNTVLYGTPLCWDSGTNASSGFDLAQWGSRGWSADEATLKTRLCTYFETNKHLITDYSDTGELNLYFFKWKHSDTGYYYFPIVYKGNDSHAQEFLII